MKKIFNDIKKTSEFNKDFKKLFKKHRTLEEDLAAFINNQLKLYHKLNIDNKGVFRISDLDIEKPKIYKAKKFACKSLKGKGAASGIRIIYAYRVMVKHYIKLNYNHRSVIRGIRRGKYKLMECVI